MTLNYALGRHLSSVIGYLTKWQVFRALQAYFYDLEDAQQEVSNAGGSLSGVLRVSALSFGVAHMSSAIAQFMHANPEVRIEMDLSDKRVDLIAEGFDVAIRTHIDRLKFDCPKNIKCAVFARCRPVIDQLPALSSPEDLQHVPALTYSNDRNPKSGTILRRRVERACCGFHQNVCEQW